MPLLQVTADMPYKAIRCTHLWKVYKIRIKWRCHISSLLLEALYFSCFSAKLKRCVHQIAYEDIDCFAQKRIRVVPMVTFLSQSIEKRRDESRLYIGMIAFKRRGLVRFCS